MPITNPSVIQLQTPVLPDRKSESYPTTDPSVTGPQTQTYAQNLLLDLDQHWPHVVT